MRRTLAVTGPSLALALALCLTTLLAPRIADACSCMAPPPPLEAAEQADAVFQAKLLAVADGPQQHGFVTKAFTFEVVRTFKGNLDPQVRVVTADNSAACGRDYGKPGSEWLIYAHTGDGGQLQDNLCSRTQPIEQAAEDIAALEGGGEPPPTTDPGPADPEPPPVLPPDQPPPAEPSKKGCTVGDADARDMLGLVAVFGLVWARRRRVKAAR